MTVRTSEGLTSQPNIPFFTTTMRPIASAILVSLLTTQATTAQDSGPVTAIGIHYGAAVFDSNLGEWHLNDEPDFLSKFEFGRELGFEFLHLDDAGAGFRATLSLDTNDDWLHLENFYKFRKFNRYSLSGELFGYLSDSGSVRPYYAAGGALGVIPNLIFDEPLLELSLRFGAGVEFGPRPGTGGFLEFGYDHTLVSHFDGETYLIGDEDLYGDSIGDWEKGFSVRLGARFGF